MSCCSEDETQAAFGEISNNLLGLVDYFFTVISLNSHGHLVACFVVILTTSGWFIWRILTKKRVEQMTKADYDDGEKDDVTVPEMS